MAKITRSTIKSFIKKNQGKLYVQFKSHFDGMVDGIEYSKNPQFAPAVETINHMEHSLGICGVWLVLGSRDSFRAYEDAEYVGYDCYNCCGNFIIAITK